MEIKMEFDYTHLGPIPDDKEINFQRLIIKEDGSQKVVLSVIVER